jgi:molybdopterin-synthase adenylyltransferase
MSNDRSNRYARQIQYSKIGRDGQDRLTAADVSVVGCGALGTVIAELLARAGVGRLRLIDRDVVEWTNLQRQSLYNESDADIGRSKAEAAAEHLSQINSEIQIDPIVADVVPSNIRSLLEGTDLVMDAVDNFAVRFLINDWSLATNTPWVHGGCVGTVGQMRLFSGAGSPCFRCLVPVAPPASSVDTCDTAGVLGPATHLVASLQSLAAMQWITGAREKVSREVMCVDLWNHRFRSIALDSAIHADCVACSCRQFEYLDGEAGRVMETAQTICGRDSVQIRGNGAVNLDRMAQRLRSVGDVTQAKFFLRVLLPNDRRLTLFRDGRVLVDGTHDLLEAKSIVDRYIGG